MTPEQTVAALTETVKIQAQQIERLTALLTALSKNPADAERGSSLTVRELYAAYERAKGGTHSWRNARNRLAPLVRRLGDLRVLELTPKVWAVYRVARAGEVLFDNETKGRTPSTGTLNLELHYAKALLNWAASPEQELISHNPLSTARTARDAGRRERCLTEDEVGAVLRVANRTLRAFVLICVDAGLRHNECRQLRRDWIRRDGTIVIPSAIAKSRKPRVVALTPRALAAIEAMPSHAKGAPELFCSSRTGKLYGSQTLLNWFQRACERAEVQGPGERIVLHTLRHTAATAALRRGVRLNSVQRMLGHSSLAVTERYLHLGDGDAVEVARLMAEGAAREGGAA